MRKIVYIVLWFVLFNGLHGVALWHLPNRYRIHPRLGKPILINPISNETIGETPICIVGDSFAHLSPWPYRKLAYPGHTLRQLVPIIQGTDLKNVERFVVLGGQTNLAGGHSPERIEEEMNELVSALEEKYPDSRVDWIPPLEVHELAKKDETGDGWHINNLGYEILRARYPELRYPTWNGKSQMPELHTISQSD